MTWLWVDNWERSNADEAPPSRSVRGSQWTEISYCAAFSLFISTVDISPRLAVGKQWRYIGVDSACVLGFWGLLKLLILINFVKYVM